MIPDRRLEDAAERALIEQCRKNDFEAFGKIVDCYQNRVLGFVRKMNSDMEEALDITQEVFIRAYQGFARFDGRSTLRTWLFRIAYNLCIDRNRKDSRSPQETALELGGIDDEPLEFADKRWDPESIMLNEEFQRVVESGIDSMSDKLKTVLLLHDREDMCYEEIAETVGIPVGTVKSRLFLARAHLQQHVSKYWSGEAEV